VTATGVDDVGLDTPTALGNASSVDPRWIEKDDCVGDPRSGVAPLELDHVLLATPDLDVATGALRDRWGVVAVGGGVHPAWGTGNRIVPVGDAYLELVAVVDDDIAVGSAFGQWVAAAARSVLLQPLGWAVRASSIDAVARRNNLSVEAGSRTTPDGRILRWRTAGVAQAMTQPCLPFFIEWSAGTPHPSQMPVSHDAGAVSVARLELDGDVSRVMAWCADDGLPISVRPGPPAVTSIVLTTATGELSIDTVRP